MGDRDIPEEMVEKAARRAVHALARQLDMDPDKLWATALQPSERDWYRSEARAVLSAALNTHALVKLPEPNVCYPDTHVGGPSAGWWVDDDHDVRAGLVDDRGRAGKPYVRVENRTGSVVFDASYAPVIAAAILAAGPAAEGLAAGSRSGEG